MLSNHFSVNSIAAKSEVEYDDTTVKGVTAKLKYVLDYYELPTSRKVTAEESEKFIALRELKQLQVTPARGVSLCFNGNFCSGNNRHNEHIKALADADIEADASPCEPCE